MSDAEREMAEEPEESGSLSKKRGRLARNALHQYVLQFAKYLFPFITIPYLTRVLGPEVYAVRAYVLATMSMVQVFLDYGFLSYGTKLVAEKRSDTRSVENASSAITYLRVVLCLCGIPIVVALCVSIPILADNGACVALAYVAVCCKATLPDYLFQGMEEMGIITRRFVGSQAVAVVLTFMFVRTPDDLVLVLLFEAIAAFVALAWSWGNVLVRRGLRFRVVSHSYAWATFKASSVFFVSSAAGALYTSLTTVLIGILVSDVAQISYWSISVSIISALQALFNPVANSLYPYMCANRDFDMAKRLLVIGIPLVAIVTVLLAVFSDFVMRVVGGAGYDEGASVLVMLSPVLLLSYPVILLGFPILAAFDEVEQLTLSTTVAAAFHIVGLGVLAVSGSFAIPAVAVLRCCTEGVLLGMRALLVRRLWRTRIYPQ